MRRSDVRAQVPVYRRTPENSVDSFSSSEEDEQVQEHTIDEHSAAAPSLVFSSIYGPRPNSINRLQLANVDLPVSPESLPHTPPRTSRPTSHHSAHNHISVTSPIPSRPLSSSLGIGIGGRAQGGLAEVFAAIANTQAQGQSTALPPSSAGSLPSPLSLSPKSPPKSPALSPANVVQEIIIKDEGYSLEQLPFKLALSNQSSLLLNRTSRAAQRRSSSLSQRQDTSSSSGVDRERRPTHSSASERLSISSLPRHPGDRPISVSTVAHVDEEEEADDEQDEEEQEIVDESPSFEALQPYPRDVSNEPSPDPTRQGFIPPAPALPPPTQQLAKPHARKDSDRHIDHEMVIDELEERFGVDPMRRRRARSNAVPNPSPSGTSPNRSTSQPTGKKADAIWERKPPMKLPKSNVDMGAARDMLGAMFAKRNQQLEEKIEEHSSDEQSFLPADWDVGSMAGLDEEEQPEKQEVHVAPEPTIVRQESTTVRRESVSARRKSSVRQSHTSIPIPRSTPAIPAPRPDEHPQTPTTASTIPETPNTQITHSTQPTPPSDHAFDETDTEDEHPEDLADLIEAEPVVLSTPRSVVLRREVGRETSLSSRAGTGTGTPGVWTPRPGSGAWTPRHGSIVNGGGLQVIESPTVDRRQHERRQSLQRIQLSPSERRQSTSTQRIEDISQTTISDATLDTVGGQTEDMSPVSRPVVSDRALVSAPVAPVLGSASPLGNGPGLGLGSVLSTPSELDSRNGLGSGVQASDVVSPSPSVPISLSPVPHSGNISGSGSISLALSGTSSDLVGSGPVLPVESDQARQSVTPTSISPVVSTLVTPASVPSTKHTSEPTVVPSSSSPAQPVVPRGPSPVHAVMPKSVPATASDPAPRAGSDLPVTKAKTLVRQEDSRSIPSVDSSPLPSSESNLTARATPSLVAGPDSKSDHPISRTLDRDSTLIQGRTSESSGVPVAPIRDTSHAGRVNLDSKRVVRSNGDTVGRHVPEQGGSSVGERKDSGKFGEDLHGNVVHDKTEDTVQEGSVGVAKEMDGVETPSVHSVSGKGAANNIEEPHEDLRGAVHQALQQEQVTNANVYRVDDQGMRQELSRAVNADISQAVVELDAHSGDSGPRALVSDSQPKPAGDTISAPTNSLSNGVASTVSDSGEEPPIYQAPVAEESKQKAAQNTPEADEVVVTRASLPSTEQALLGEATREKGHEQPGVTVDLGVEQVGANLGGREAQEDMEGTGGMGQDASESGLRDEVLNLGSLEPVARALSKGDGSTTEEVAGAAGLGERVTPKILTTPVLSELASAAPDSELASITNSRPEPALLSSVPIEDEAALEPDHIDSLSELEQSFGVRSPVMDGPSRKPASSDPVTPSLPPTISAPMQASSHSAPSIPERSPMLPPLAPIAPLSPILASSASVSPSSPEPPSPPTSSSPPTTSSLPASPSPVASSATKAPVPLEPLPHAGSLEPERRLPTDSALLESSAAPQASSLSPVSDLPLPAEYRSTPKTLSPPESPSLEPSPELDLGPLVDRTSESDTIPALQTPLELEPVSSEEVPSGSSRPESPKSYHEPSVSDKSAALARPSLPLDPFPLPGPSETYGALPSPTTSEEEYSPPLKRSSLPRSPVVDELSATPATLLIELSQPHAPSPSPDPESSSPEAGLSSPGPSQSSPASNLPPVLDDSHPLSEPASGSNLSASKAISTNLSKPATLPESPKLPESIPLPNSPLSSNTCLPDVSLPLEPLSPPRPPLLDSPPPEPAVLPEPSSLLNSSSLQEPSPLISPPLFEPSPWPGLSVVPKPPPSTSSPVSSSHGPLPLPDHHYSPESSPSPHPGPLPNALPNPKSSAEPELPPTEDLQEPQQLAEPVSSEAEYPNDSQEHGKLPVTPDRRHMGGAPDPLSPWGSLRFRRSPGIQGSLDEEQQLPKSSLLFDYASLPADSPPGSRTPLTRLPPLPEDSLLLEYAPPTEQVQPEGQTERFESGGLPEYVVPPEGPVVGTLVMSPRRPAVSRSQSPVDSQLSQRSSLSEIPSLSDFAPLPIRSDTAPQQYVRTATLASEPRAASEPSSKPRPRSQLKPLRLSLLHGLRSPSPGAIITPITANTITPSPGLQSEAVTPTPTAMYPTPSSAHPTQRPVNVRSDSQSSTSEQATEANAMPEPTRELNGLDSVSWFGAKKGVKRGTLSAARQSNRGSVQGSNRSSQLHDESMVSSERGTTSAVERSSSYHSLAAAEDEDVRPLPMIWDDETEAGSKAGSSRQGTRSPTQSQSHVVPVLEAFPPDTAPADVAPPLKTPDRLDTVPRYPTFVNVGASSPRISDGRSPLSSPRAASEHVSEPSEVQEPDVEPVDPRSRKWADTVNQDSIGSLPDFNAPAPSKQMSDGQPSESKEPHTPGKRKDRRHYMKIPNTAPLSISPRRVSPSIMQRSQEGTGSFDQDVSSLDEMKPYDMPRTAPLDLRMRMPHREGTNGPWMTEFFTNSPSSFHGSQLGSMHSASSSLSTGAKAVDIRRSVSSRHINGPVHVEDGTFGNPGPGPSTMKTFTERRQSAEILRSPIALRSPSLERAPSVPKTPQPQTHPEPTKRRSSQLTLASMDATPRKGQDTLQLKVSSADSISEIETSPHSGTPSAVTQPLVENQGDEVSPSEQRTPYKALSLSSPSPGRQPATPLTASSPLQILRRNLMARTSPDSPRFLSPQTKFTNLPEPRLSRHQHHASASLAPMTRTRDEFQRPPMSAPGPRDRRSLTPNTRFTATPSIPGSPAQSVHSTISQTKPLLFFAIAKNSAQEVEKLLQDGDVKPNDKAGPEDLPALAFTLANEQLSDKTQIVKSLLSHGADPSSVLHRNTGSGQFDDADIALTTRIEQGMNPAIRYYLNRKQMTIPAPQAELLEKNNFGGLTRAGFSIIGQDAALEELIRVVAGHCRRQALNPLVVVFSGGPGCGKSLLASKIGPLLHVPYFTVNMTNLRNEAALFNYISMTTKAGQPQIPLMDFLRNNQGQRCVVVLEEIEKAADKTVWHSLLMPWEWGKATVISPTNNEQIDIDTSQVIWIATSNSGDDATLKFFAERSRPSERGESALVRLAHNPRSKEDNFTRKDYLQLMQAVRKRLGELLGSSMISRVSSVLPFLPFTEDEVYALASESLSAMRAEQKGDQSYDNVDWEELLQQAVGEYIPGEGARSVHRAVQRAFDEIAEW